MDLFLQVVNIQTKGPLFTNSQWLNKRTPFYKYRYLNKGTSFYKYKYSKGPLFRKSYHHHHVTASAQISLTLYRHPSLLSITSGRSSGLHRVSTQSCCMYVQAGHPAFAQPCEGVHKSTSLMSSSLLLQQGPACLVRLILIVFVMSGWWSYSCCCVECCLLDLFNIARSIPV